MLKPILGSLNIYNSNYMKKSENSCERAVTTQT